MTTRTQRAQSTLSRRPSVATEIADHIRDQASSKLTQARPMPARAYVDPEFYELEVERIFRRDWLAVARVEQVPNVGDFVTVDLPDEPLVIVRDKDNTVRVMSRVCRHRYADVLADTRGTVSGSGCAEFFECPYHLWSYRLDGSLINAVDFARRAEFDATRFGLRQIRSEIWQGFVFVNLDEESTRPLGLEPLTEALGHYNMSQYRIVRSKDWGELDAGWKVVLENFLEFYHHMGAHRSTLEPMAPGLGAVCADGHEGPAVYYSWVKFSAELAAGEVDGHLQPTVTAAIPAELTPADRSGGFIASRFPLFMMATSPSYNYWLQIVPTGPETHKLIVHSLAPLSSIEQLSEADHDDSMAFFDDIQIEDAAVNGRVQTSMHSHYARGGVFHEQEFALLHFQRYIAEMLGG